jgi:hypothetical protein
VSDHDSLNLADRWEADKRQILFEVLMIGNWTSILYAIMRKHWLSHDLDCAVSVMC